MGTVFLVSPSNAGMTLFELTRLLDTAVSRHASLRGWSYIELRDDDAHIDIETVSGVIRAHIFLETAFTAFLRTENHFVRVETPEDFVCSLVALS